VQGPTTANNIEISGEWIQSFNRGGSPGYQALPIYASTVTIPNQPAFSARGATNTTYSTSGWKKINYTTIVDQTGSNYSTSTSRFTAPVSGWYQFNATANFNSNSDADGAITVVVNGTTTDTRGKVAMSQNGGNYNGRSVAAVMYLSANEYVEVWVYSTVNLVSRLDPWAGNFSGYLVA
jgi:hypothetical protein